MPRILPYALVISCGFAATGYAEDDARPAELDVLKRYVGVWDAAIEVWPAGPDGPKIKFEGVDTIRAFGDHWIVSDFDSEFMGQKTSVHSIIGYDLDAKRIVGKQVDAGPYAATMSGEYDAKTRTMTWTVKVKDANGKPMEQKTSDTIAADGTRLLILNTTGADGESRKFMQIRYTKRNP